MEKRKVFRISYLAFSILFIAFCSLVFWIWNLPKAHAALGVNRVINFQGRVVKKADGTNVTDGTYSFTFKLYDAASGGNLLWQETQSSVSLTSGIFQVSLGSATAFNAGGYNVNFDSNSLYLDITFNSETFGSRIQLSTVPYAVNSEQLDSIIATPSAGGFTLSGGQSTVSNASFTTSGSTLTFQPGVAGGLTVQSNGANNLTLDTGVSGGSVNIGNTNAASVAIGNNSAANNTSVTLTSGGTGNITLGGNNGIGNVVIHPNAGGQAALIVNDNTGTGDTFTASASGTTQFRITNSGAFLFQDSVLIASGSGSAGNGSGVSENALGDEGSLIPNAGFESAIENAWGDGWYPAATTSANIFTRDTSTPAKGSGSLLATPANGTTVALYSSCIPVAGGIGSYTLNYYAKASSATKMQIGAIVDTYSSKANCQSDTTPTLAVVKASNTVTTSWATYGSGTNGVLLPSSTWGRIHFLFTATQAGATGEIDGVRFTEQSTGQGLDYAENYPTDASNSARAGDVVTLKSGGPLATVIPATNEMDSAIGVVSTNPGYVLDDGSITSPKVPIALVGRVPVKVSTLNGPIHLGDYLTASSIPGVAVKAASPGGVIGTALEDYSLDLTQVGEIMMFVKNTYYNGINKGLIGGPTAITEMIGTQETTKDIKVDLGAIASAGTNVELGGTGSNIAEGIISPLPQASIEKDNLKTTASSSGLLVNTNSSISAIASLSAAISNLNSWQAGIASVSVRQNNSLNLASLQVLGLATVSADLRVKQNTLIEGILTVVNTFMAQDIIANGLSEFFGNVIFHSNVTFQKPPTFNQDTAGYAVLHKGDKSVDIAFVRQYLFLPVVNATIIAPDSSSSANKMFVNGYSYLLSNVSNSGFTLILNKPAADDVKFSWDAIEVASGSGK